MRYRRPDGTGSQPSGFFAVLGDALRGLRLGYAHADEASSLFNATSEAVESATANRPGQVSWRDVLAGGKPPKTIGGDSSWFSRSSTIPRLIRAGRQWTLSGPLPQKQALQLNRVYGFA